MLQQITESKHFCKLDNSIVGSIREIAATLQITKSTLARELSRLKADDVLRLVEDVYGNNVLMVSLDTYCTMYPVEEHFHRVMYELRSHERTEDFVRDERKRGRFTDPATGEQLGLITKHWHKMWMNHRNNPKFGKFGTRNMKRANITMKTTETLEYAADSKEKARRLNLAYKALEVRGGMA